VVVLLQGGVKYDEKFSCVSLRSGERHKCTGRATGFFSPAEMCFLIVSVMYGEGGLVWCSSGSVVSLCDSDLR
jgi:hypothetical protein